MKYYIFILIFLIVSCKNNESSNHKEPSIDPSFSLFNSKFDVKKRGINSFFSDITEHILFDFDTINSEIRDTLSIDTIFHQFKSVRFPNIKDMSSLSETKYIFSWSYYEKHKFEPNFLSLRFYSDNLLGLNIASPIKGQFLATIYDKKTGDQLSTYSEDDFDGSFYLGSASRSDTFEDIRLVVLLDTFLYEKSFSKMEIIDK